MAVLEQRLAGALLVVCALTDWTAGLAQEQGRAVVVSPLEVTANMAPVPAVGEGAPLLSVGELETARTEARKDAAASASASRNCNRNGDRLLPTARDEEPSLATLTQEASNAYYRQMEMADRASRASAAALNARVEAAKGAATAKQVEDAELARQAAVKLFVAARDASAEADARIKDRLQVKRMQERGLPKQAIKGEMARLAAERHEEGGAGGIVIGRANPDLALADLRAAERTDQNGSALLVSGQVRNSGKRAARLPPLSFTAVDRFGSALSTEITDPRRARRVPAGGSVPFSYEFRPRPVNAASVLVNFGKERSPDDGGMIGMYCSGGEELSPEPPGRRSGASSEGMLGVGRGAR